MSHDAGNPVSLLSHRLFCFVRWRANHGEIICCSTRSTIEATGRDGEQCSRVHLSKSDLSNEILTSLSLHIAKGGSIVIVAGDLI